MAAALSLAATAAAWGFDFARYQEADLDDLLEAKRPKSGADIYPAPPYKITVDLVSYGERCSAAYLKTAMRMGGAPRGQVDALPVNSCVKIRSARGKVQPVFIQDQVAEFLPKEVPLGSKVILYVIHVYTQPDGPGFLVNEFVTGKTFAGQDGPCGCGGADAHPGSDFNAPEGTPVPAVDEGVVVKVEADENAMVDAPRAGWCGRYVVVRHSYPNGRVAFTRYAQLGRLVDGNGNPLKVGAHVVKGTKIGEVGSDGELHYEVRPVEPASMNTGAIWQRRYGADPAMEWSKYQPIDPTKFDADAFGGRAKTK
jgi:hypothetical protein